MSSIFPAASRPFLEGARVGRGRGCYEEGSGYLHPGADFYLTGNSRRLQGLGRRLARVLIKLWGCSVRCAIPSFILDGKRHGCPFPLAPTLYLVDASLIFRLFTPSFPFFPPGPHSHILLHTFYTTSTAIPNIAIIAIRSCFQSFSFLPCVYLSFVVSSQVIFNRPRVSFPFLIRHTHISLFGVSLFLSLGHPSVPLRGI